MLEYWLTKLLRFIEKRWRKPRKPGDPIDYWTP
jgi:hypothetical protein